MKNTYEHKADVIEAFRRAVYPDVKKFLQLSTFNQEGRCVRCNQIYSSKFRSFSINHVQVEHVVPFEDILNDFMTDFNFSFDKIQVDTTFHMNTLLNPVYYDLWVQYYEKYAQLQLVCKRCSDEKIPHTTE